MTKAKSMKRIQKPKPDYSKATKAEMQTGHLLRNAASAKPKTHREPKRITVTEVELPGYAGETKVTVIGNRIVFVEADHDQDCSNPCEDCDGFGSIRSLSNRHINNIDIDEAVELLKSDADAVALSYFEHGQSLWMVAGSDATRTPGVEFQWDGTRFAGVWIPDKCVRESFTSVLSGKRTGNAGELAVKTTLDTNADGLTRREWMVKQAEHACETYTEWANGQCFGYDVQVFKVLRGEDGEVYEDREDYRRETPLQDDSCWGFIGWDYFEDEMRDVTRGILRRMYSDMRFSKRAIARAFATGAELAEYQRLEALKDHGVKVIA